MQNPNENEDVKDADWHSGLPRFASSTLNRAWQEMQKILAGGEGNSNGPPLFW